MKVSVETITPAKAAEMLSRRGKNRMISNGFIQRYAADMASGKWKLNGSAIVFDEHDELIDGQHRLMACAQSGIGFATLVARGAESGSFPTIDQGRPRAPKDALHLSGEVNTGELASALGTLWLFENGWSMQREDAVKLVAGANGNGRARISIAEYVGVLERHPKIRYSLSLFQNKPYNDVRGIVPKAMAAAMHRIFSDAANEILADDFFKMLATGAGLEYGHPILMLRNMLLNVRDRGINIQGGGGIEKRLVYVGLLIKAWNAWLAGKTIGTMSYKRRESIQAISTKAE